MAVVKKISDIPEIQLAGKKAETLNRLIKNYLTLDDQIKTSVKELEQIKENIKNFICLDNVETSTRFCTQQVSVLAKITGETVSVDNKKLEKLYPLIFAEVNTKTRKGSKTITDFENKAML